MESNVRRGRRVKEFEAKSVAEFARIHREIPDCRTRVLYLRLLAYLDGAFRSPRMRYKWQKELLRSFAKRSGYSLTHIEDAFPGFKRWCSTYKFGYEQIGPSRFAVIRRNFGVLQNVTGAEIHERLTGAIRRMVAMTGRCHADRQFMVKFCERTRLPFEGVARIWEGLRHLAGMRCRWRGVGRGRKFVAHGARDEKMSGTSRYSQFAPTVPPTSLAFSSSFGGEETKTAGAVAPEAQAGSPLAPLASNRVEVDTARGGAPPGPSQGCAGYTYRPGSADGGDVPTKPAFSPGDSPAVDPPFTGGRPLQICNRWISPRKLAGLVRYLAFVRLKNVHREFPRVEFRAAHAINFAREAVQLGYPKEAIEAAWRVGVMRSHEDALDADRLPGGGYASVRPPSAAKVYAIGELQKFDAATWRDRWSALVQRPRLGPENRAPGPDVVPGVGEGARGSRRAETGVAAATPARFTAAEAAAKLAELRRAIAKPATAAHAETSVAGLPELTAPDVFAYLKTRSLTPAQLRDLPYREQQRIFAQARAWRARSVDKP